MPNERPQEVSVTNDDGTSTRRIDLLVLSLAIPIGFALSPFYVFSVDTGMVSVCDIGLVVYTILVVVRAMTGERRMVVRMDVPMLSLGALFLAGVLSGIPPLVSGNSAYMNQCMKSFVHFSYMWFFAVCCAATVVKLDNVLTLFRWFVIIAIPINIFGMYQVPARAFDLPFAWIEYTGSAVRQSNQLSLEFSGFFRATSIFSEPSAFAMYTMTTAIMLLVPYFLFNVRIIRSRFIFYTALYSSFIGMFLTFSLTIVLLFSVFVAVLAVFARTSATGKFMAMITVMTVIFSLTNQAISTYADAELFDLYFGRIVTTVFGGDHVEGIVGESFDTRADAQRTAIMVWKQSPVFGIGFGCIGFARDTDALTGVHVLQTYLTGFATAGILGGLSTIVYMISLNVGMVRLLYRRLQTMGSDRRAPTEDVVLAVVTFLGLNQAVHGLSSDDLIYQYHWAILGVVHLVYYHPVFRATRPESSIAVALTCGLTAPFRLGAAGTSVDHFAEHSQRKSHL